MPVEAPIEEPTELAAAAARGMWCGPDGLAQIAQLLWLPGRLWPQLFELEYEVNKLACGGGGYELPPSSYRARLKGERAERYDSRRRRQERDQMAIELHANNMRRWSPSLVGRSVYYFNRDSTAVREGEAGPRRLASNSTTWGFLRTMRDCQPPPRCARGRHTSVYGFDQTYEWVGMQKHGRRGTVERVDATGMPIQITHEVYVNSIKIHLPESLGNLSHADRARIAANHGSAYTEDRDNVYAALRPDVVRASLNDLAADALCVPALG